MQDKRDVTFDIMKGIGIILVMVGHVWSVYLPNLHHFIYSFHMPMFFLVAGYFSKGYVDKQTSWQSVKHFFRRLCVPAMITQIAIVLWSVLNKYAKGVSWDGTICELLSLFWADPYGPITPWGRLSYGVIWFLLALFFSKCMLLVLSRLKIGSIVVAFALSIGSIVLFNVFPYSIWCITLSLNALPFVVFGWWFRNHKIPVWLIIVCVVCWVFAIAYSDLDMYCSSYGYGCYPLDVLGASGGTLVFYLLCKAIGKLTTRKVVSFIPRLFAYLGTISLIIMCVHCFEMSAHLGSHLAALFGIEFSLAGMYVFRYLLTIGISIVIALFPEFYSRMKMKLS